MTNRLTGLAPGLLTAPWVNFACCRVRWIVGVGLASLFGSTGWRPNLSLHEFRRVEFESCSGGVVVTTRVLCERMSMPCVVRDVVRVHLTTHAESATRWQRRSQLAPNPRAVAARLRRPGESRSVLVSSCLVG